MALAIHELTTNLRRHGVLGTPTGGVTVHWRHDEPHDDLVVTWVERNGSAIAEGPRERFGFEIVRAVIEIQLEGSVQLDWSTGALICRLGVPVRHLLPRPPV